LGAPSNQYSLNIHISNLSLGYLGSILEATGATTLEIEKRISEARRVIGMLNSVLWSKTILHKTKKLMYQALVQSILLYAAETWTLNQGRGVHVTGVSAAYTFKLNKNILSE
jgi:hypothetical protein